MQLIFYTRAAHFDNITSLQGFHGWVIPVSEVAELLTKIHYTLDNDISKWIGNMVCILAYALILLLGSVMKSGLCSSTFFTIARTLFLLVRLAFVVTLTGL